ncbi:MAG TPA: Ig-like domain-containing protein [Patescibacteria group bacterium]|nr:Ig-like domain-containing protein [Patescibacteria group bacterium]
MKQILFSLLALSLLVPSLAFAEGAPTISEVSPLEAVVDVPVTLSVTATDSDGVASCSMKISSIDRGSMTYNSSNGLWEFEWTFDDTRTASSVRAYCTDNLGNAVNGPPKILEILEIPRSLEIGDPDVTPTETTDEVDATDFTEEMIILTSPVLIKTPCPGGEDFTHPCRTVYFLDNLGTRHAFPNEKAYFTWYTDWSNIHVITTDIMAALPLGGNVRYHPGTKMVKYPSANQVYVVGVFGDLIEVDSEATAEALYGANWNQQIDDVSEAFFGNYTYGAADVTIDTYNPETARNSVTSINDNIWEVWHGM